MDVAVVDVDVVDVDDGFLVLVDVTSVHVELVKDNDDGVLL